MVYLVLIFINPGKGEVLRQYERHASHVMAKHGGHFERIFQPLANGGRDIPDEIHLLHFDTAEGFQAFRADPDLDQFKHLREEAVARAVVLAVQDYPLADYFKES